MTKVTNHHASALGLPGGIVLPAGVATEVPAWDQVSKNSVVKAWVERKILTVGSAEPEPSKGPQVEDDKASLQAQLDKLGVNYNKRSGVDKLRAALAEAEKAESAPDSGKE